MKCPNCGGGRFTNVHYSRVDELETVDFEEGTHERTILGREFIGDEGWECAQGHSLWNYDEDIDEDKFIDDLHEAAWELEKRLKNESSDNR